MKKIVLASVSALALLTVSACSDTDNTTTQSVEPMEDSVPVTPAPDATTPPAAAPEAPAELDTLPAEPMEPAPAEPAPAE
ncbi:MAG: hypothetical protein AB7I79_19950 [Rhizobiaceae bacterium]